ncbi:MAG: phage terminase large subunit [Rhodospirillaceae bacterium]|nr:phage terminase large subunit [Rhodospirillaceae bacterium]
MFDLIDTACLFEPHDFALATQRERLLPYVQAVSPRFIAGRYHHHLCAELERFSHAIIMGGSPRLIIEAPPRHGKSYLVSEHFPVWHLGNCPTDEIIIASYGLSPAQDRSAAARQLANQHHTRAVFPGMAVTHDTRAKKDWKLTTGGSVVAAGRGGPIVSKGANILILDDLIKNYEEAHSPLIREATWNWYKSSAYTRLYKSSGVIIILTRWHADDIVGRVLQHHAVEGWQVVSYSAIAKTDEAWRKAGEALHPERFPLDWLERRREVLGTAMFEALYQQNPITEGGSVWLDKWWRYWTIDPTDTAADTVQRPERFRRIVQSWDLSFKKTGKSYVVGQVWGEDFKGNFYLLDQVRGRWGFVETKAQIQRMNKKWPRTKKILIEDAANGPAVMDALKAELGHKIVPVRPDGSKVARARAAAPFMEAARVFLPKGAPWLPVFKRECAAFPNGPDDDQVDTTSQGLRFLGKPGGVQFGCIG